MAANRVAAFLTVLRESQLLETNQIEELARCPEARAGDLNGLAKVILQKGWLTRFQLTLISQGKTKELMLGPYRLLDRLGEGGMGQVFKAYHQPMSRTVALKLIRKEKLANPQAVQRFFREVQAAAKLVHPNIVVAFDANQVNGTHYFAMEFVDGIDLAKLVKQNGPLPVQVACDYIRQAALGLQHAHEQGMVHRDIKPHNLLVTQVRDAGSSSSSQPGQKAVVKILDMGLARLSSASDQGLTQDGAVIGTPEYIPPEQALNARNADIRADLYSLGGVLFYLLTGRPPFQGGTLTEMLLKHQMEAAPDVRHLRADVPDDVAEIVARLLAKRPEERFQTPLELAQALEPICQGGSNPYVLPRAAVVDSANIFGDLGSGSIDSRSGATVVQSPSVARSSARSRKLQAKGPSKGLIAAVATAAVALIGVVVYLVLPKGSDDNTPRPAQSHPQIASPGTEKYPPSTARAEPPTVGELDVKPAGPITLKSGTSTVLQVQIERKSGPNQSIQMRLEGLPPGVSADAVTLDASRDTAQIKLTAQPNAPESLQDVQVVASDGGKESKADFSLTVQAATVAVKLPPPGEGELKRFSIGGTALPRAVWVLPDGQAALLLYNDGTFHEWDLESGRTTASALTTPMDREYKARSASADARLVFVGRPDHTAVLLNRQTGQQIQVVRHPTAINLVALSPDGKVGLTVGGETVTRDGQSTYPDAAVRAWDLQSGKELARLDRPDELVRVAALSSDGRRAVTFASPGVMVLWDTRDAKVLRTGKLVGGAVNTLRFSPDGRLIFAGCTDRRVRFFDGANMELVREITGHEGSIHCTAVSADGKYLLTGVSGSRVKDGVRETYDCTVRLWEIETGREVKRFVGHQGTVWAVAFLPDGRRALSAADDNTIRIWDLGMQTAVAVKPPDEPPVRDMKKAEPPDAAKQAEALKLIKELFKTDYARTKAPERRALAVKLMDTAAKAKEDVASRYVLLREGADLAAAGGSGEFAAKAIDQLGEEFIVDAADLKLKALTTASNISLNTLDQKATAEAALAAVDTAADAENYELALQLTTLAESAARKAQAVPLLPRIAERSKGLKEMQKESEATQAAAATLKEKPDDPDANLTLGRFLCLRKEDWDRGLPLLARGTDAKLKDAAEKDLKAVKGTTNEQLEAGDAWYELARAADATTKPALQVRAHSWYSAAQPQATGITKTRIDQRVAEIQPLVDTRAARKTKIWLVIRRALADKQIKRGGIVGGTFFKETYEEVPTQGALLIGFHYTTVRDQYPGFVQPIFLTADGEVKGKAYGVPEPGVQVQVVKAKKGYAVGAIYTRGGGAMDAFKPIFMKITENGLDTADSYDGTYVGGNGGAPGMLGGDGNFIVGFHGLIGNNGKMEALSPVSLTTKLPPGADLEASLDALNVSQGTKIDDYVRTRGRIETNMEYTGPIDITAVARTDQHNIRLHAYRGSCVIFNWEGNPKDLRVHRPDGRDSVESGSVAAMPVEPLSVDTWHTLRWRLTREGCEVWADGKLVFSESRPYDVSAKQRLAIGSNGSNVDIRTFLVKPLK